MFRKLVCGVVLSGLFVGVASATGADAASVIAPAQTAFGLVQDFIVTCVGFFMVVKVVKWFRK